MRNLTYRAVAAFIGLAAVTSAQAADAPAPFWQKTWTVATILGPPDATAQMGEYIGKPVILTTSHAETPVSEPCDATPRYADVRARPRRELPKHFGPFWKFPAALGARPVFGWVRCGTHNFGAFAFSDARHGYFFFEEGMVFVLR